VSCEEVMKAYIKRCKQVNGYINAIVDDRYEAALESAKEFDEILASEAKSEDEIAKDTPLFGVPFTCKEALGIKGLLQTSGMVRSKCHSAIEDADVAAAYRNAGAIPVTVTNVPELCMWWETANNVFGRTKNPYGVTRSVGGSSGGEAALITSAGALIGIGHDNLSSGRIPASFCGIYAHKPSQGCVSNYGEFPFSEMESDVTDETDIFISTGPMCRYAQDLPLLLHVLSEKHPKLQLNAKVDFRKVKLYYIEQFPGILNCSIPSIRNAIYKAVKHFELKYGVKAKPASFPELKDAFSIWQSKLLEYGEPPFTFYLKGGESKRLCLWWEFCKYIVGYSEYTLPAIYYGMVQKQTKDHFYYTCLRKCKELERKFKEILQDEDAILLLPTHPEHAPHYLMTIPLYPSIAYTSIFNILGYPATQIPVGVRNYLPLGIQAVSGKYKDHLTIAAAMELDKVFGGWIKPCAIMD
ncbi:fatty-acid amide hydrolase 2, partial [Caerostris extrusa]